MKSVLAAAAGLLVFVLAVPAWAHVTVSSPEATRGGYAVLDFRVPSESDTASTVKVAVQLPPFASVAVRPLAGWTIKTQESPLATPLVTDDGDKVTSAVTEVEWTAANAASGIAPGRFQEFAVSVGPLPDTDSVGFGTVQTYSDGKQVLWNEVAAPGAAEPAHPKPTLQLAGAAAPAPRARAANTTAPTVLSIVALVVAAAALGFAVVGNARRSSRTGAVPE